MKAKKKIAIIMLLVLVLTQFNFIAFTNAVNAQTNEEIKSGVIAQTGGEELQADGHYRYYYVQLNEIAKSVYNAMYDMYMAGELKTGTAKYDLIERNYVSEDVVKAYVKGDKTIIEAVESARDAFYLDYPEVFYVNMEKLSIRITNGNGRYHLWLGTGNEASYMLDGFSSATDISNAEVKYNKAVQDILNEAQKLETDKEKITYVHNQVIASTEYKLDNVCKPENRGHIRTPYGALVAREAVCEGYSKSVKVLLDKLGIPCVLVRGVYKANDGSRVEAHMWAYAQLDGKWYAVDATFDDYDGLYADNTYLLAGYSTMQKEHNPTGVMSNPNFEFELPELEYEDYGIVKACDYNGLVVNYGMTTGETLEGDAVIGGKFYINYKGMGMAKARDNGYYFLVRYNNTGDWHYMEALREYMDADEDSEKELLFFNSNMQYIEIGITTIKYKEPVTGINKVNGAWVSNEIFTGREEDIIAKTDVIENTYKWTPSPAIVSATPYLGTKLKPGKKTHITITYNDTLVSSEDGEKPSVYIDSNAWTSSAELNSKIENFGHSKNKVWFDFTPSTMWGDNNVVYYFKVKGLVGSKSKLAPRASYYYIQESFGCTYSMLQANKWRVYGRPTLIDTGDVDFTGWELEDGVVTPEEARALNQVKEKLMLVATPTTKAQDEEIDNLVKNSDSKADVLKTECYNINLTVCNKNALKLANGDKMTVYLGFPEGYGPESAGVIFKAYHIGKNNEVEEIDCVVTPYGLLVTCNAFSPYAVAAVRATEEELQNATKYAVISADENGVISGASDNIIKLEPGQSVNCTISANTGYSINSLSVFGTEIKNAVNKSSYEITVKYEDIIDGNNIVDATFVAETVAQAEVANGETIVTPVVEKATIDMPEEVIGNVGEEAKIEPTIISSNGIDTYQWYKDGEIVAGQTNSVLSIDPVKVEDEGMYTLVITSVVGTLSETTTSTACKLLTSDFDIELSVVKDKVVPGELIEVNAYLKNLRNIGVGLIGVKGQLEFNTNYFEIYRENKDDDALLGEEGWNLSSFNDDNFKFVAENRVHVAENSHLFTLYLRVKETVTTEQEATIKLKNVSASGGNGVVLAVSDAEETIHIVMEEEKPYFTSEKYNIIMGTDMISRVLPNSTVETVKNNINTNQTIIFVNTEGRDMADSDIVTTGTIIRIINKDTYTDYQIAVIADIDGDGEVTANDLAIIKLHLIDKQEINGVNELAANIDETGPITINDMAKLKLILIGKLILE